MQITLKDILSRNNVIKPKCGCIACPYYDESIEVMHCPFVKSGEKGWPCWGYLAPQHRISHIHAVQRSSSLRRGANFLLSTILATVVTVILISLWWISTALEAYYYRGNK
jgi:hypothetical protein